MLQVTRLHIFVTASVLTVLSGAIADAGKMQPASTNAFTIAWDRTYRGNTSWTEFRAISRAASGEMFVGATEHDALDAPLSKLAKPVVWRIGVNGDVLAKTEVKWAARDWSNTASVRDVLALDGGQVLALIDIEAGRPAVVKIDRSGKQILTKELAPQQSTALTLFRVIPMEDRFLLIGHESFDAFLMEIDGRGTVLWQKKNDRGKKDFFVDGVPAANGRSSVLVGNSGEYDPLRAGPSLIWVGRYDLNGQMEQEVTFQGRFGRIARAGDNDYVIVYDQSSTNDQNIHVKRLNSDLKELWDVSILNAKTNFSDFTIAPARNGEFVVVGGKGGGPHVTTIDGQGRHSVRLTGAAAVGSIDVGTYGAATADGTGELLIACTHIDVLKPLSVRQSVRIRRISM